MQVGCCASQWQMQLCEAELNHVEKKYGIDLGRTSAVAETNEDYFRQFDESVRREASEMSRHYEIFYCLEKTIRALISETLKAAAGETWWDSESNSSKNAW